MRPHVAGKVHHNHSHSCLQVVLVENMLQALFGATGLSVSVLNSALRSACAAANLCVVYCLCLSCLQLHTYSQPYSSFSFYLCAALYYI